MVTAAHPVAVKTGYEILRQGGSAVDAAIAVQMVLNLVEPQSSGIGGGAFLLYWNAEDRSLISIDGRETAPRSAQPDHFLNESGKPLSFSRCGNRWAIDRHTRNPSLTRAGAQEIRSPSLGQSFRTRYPIGAPRFYRHPSTVKIHQ